MPETPNTIANLPTWQPLPVPSETGLFTCLGQPVRLTFKAVPAGTAGLTLWPGKSIRVKAGDAGFIRPHGARGGILTFTPVGALAAEAGPGDELASLFEFGQAGYAPDGYSPYGSSKPYQDAAGTTPATTFGQPVGYSLGRSIAAQGVALSRPTLARHPKGGRRNLVVEGVTGQAPNGAIATYTPATQTYLLENMSAAAGIRWACGAGGNFASQWVCASIELRAVPGFEGNATVSLTRISGAAVSDPEVVAVSSEWTRCDLAILLNADNTTGFELRINHATGNVDKVEFRHVQMARGQNAGPYQRVINANNITEAGSPDLWHLANDGGDSLPLTQALPEGAYGIASVSATGEILIETATSDGTTPFNTLRTARQVNVRIRQGEFTPEEIEQIETAWARYAA